MIRFILIGLLILCASNVRAQTEALVPIQDFILNDDEEEPFSCVPKLVSLTHPKDATIPVGDDFGITISYEVKNRPLDREIGFSGYVVLLDSEGNGSGLALQKRDSQGRDHVAVAEINQGEKNFTGQLTFTRNNDRFFATNQFNEIGVTCIIAYRQNGSHFTYSGPENSIRVKEEIDWKLVSP